MSLGYGIRAGQLRHRVEIQNVTRTRSSTGASTLTYSTVTNAWASITQLKGQELERMRQAVPTATHIIRMRKVNGLSEGNRIIYNGHYFDINDVNDIDMRGKVMEITATENKGNHGGDGKGVA